jgi:phosphatidylserine decarboxylase
MSWLFVTLQHLLPHHLLCRVVYRLTRSHRPWLKNALIGAFARAYRPAMEDALEPEPLHYPSFNAFFTRALREGARPIDPDPRQLTAPCDGTLSMAAQLQDDAMLQAKGHLYTLPTLLGADTDLQRQLRGGSYATIYLAPYNYHRIHMPLAGWLRSSWLIPGRLYSVNAATVQRVPGLFARNERLVCVFDSEHGPFVVVLVGALFVGSMSTVWHGEVTPARGAATAGGSRRALVPLEISTGVDAWQARGAELGRFNMGSTVLLLLPPGMATWNDAAWPGLRIQVGQSLGTLR